jgi:hypothetical protein
MGWGINFTTDIYLSRTSFNDRQEVLDKISENEIEIRKLVEQIKMFAIANVRDIVPEDWKEEPVLWISLGIDGLMEQISEIEWENVRLHYYEEFLLFGKEGENE